MLKDLKTTMSADVTRYARPGRERRTAGVRARAVADQRFVIAKPERTRKEPKEPKRYRADKSVIGLGTVCTAFSLPREELRKLDQEAESRKMSRSHFLREAVRFYIDATK